MHPEIYSILDDMKIRRPKNPIANSDIQTYLQVQSSNILVLLAEENEKSAKKLEKLTKTLTVLTWFIAILTAFLVLSVFFEFSKFPVKFPQKPALSIEKTTENKNNKDIQTLPERGHHVPNIVTK